MFILVESEKWLVCANSEDKIFRVNMAITVQMVTDKKNAFQEMVTGCEKNLVFTSLGAICHVV